MKTYPKRKRTFTRYSSTLAVCIVATLWSVPNAKAQYPNISSEIKAESDARKAAADKHSDEAWEKALPIVKEWEARGKPYIPWAGEPKDLPFAKIPAFPGAQGGGMYSFGG